jgi:hypothetical protein
MGKYLEIVVFHWRRMGSDRAGGDVLYTEESDEVIVLAMEE